MVYAISKRGYTNEYYGYAAVVLRGTMLGFVAGMICGAVIGAVLYPLAGALFGAYFGAIVGGLFGLPCALVLGFVSWARPGVAATRMASVVIAMAWATVAVVCFDPDGYVFFVYVVFPLGAISAAVVGPRAVFRRDRPSLLPPTEPRHARA